MQMLKLMILIRPADQNDELSSDLLSIEDDITIETDSLKISIMIPGLYSVA